MRFVKMAVNATSAGVCLLLERTGHATGVLNTLVNLSLALSLFVLVVAAIHELVQGRTELLHGTGNNLKVTASLDTQEVSEAVSEERYATGQSSESVPAIACLRKQ